MTFEDALKILGLKPDYTDEELKSAWRKLSKENHPDKHHDEEQMTEKQALINAARDYLKNYQGSRTSKNKFDISEYIDKKIAELENIIKDSDSFSGELKSTSEAIKRIIRGFKITILTAYSLNKKDVDKEFENCKRTIKERFEVYQQWFYKEHGIDKKDVQETINYDCTLQEFHNQLLKIKEKYSKELLLSKRLDIEIAQYKSYAGYERLSILIDVCKNNAKFAIKQNNYQNIESEIAKMHKRILTEVFDAYYKIKRKIDDLADIVKQINDDTITKDYQELKSSFDKGKSFADTEEAIKELEEKINKYREQQEKQLKYKENEPAINQIYQDLITRYSEAIKHYNIVTEYKSVHGLSELLKQILQVFIQGCQEFKNLEYFNQFKNITFKNLNNDNNIIQNLSKCLKSKKSNIYLKKTNQYTVRGNVFFYHDEDNNIMYQISYNTIPIGNISSKQLATEYMSLEEFLETAEFIGEFRKEFGKPIRYLYKNYQTVIYFKDHNYHITPFDLFFKYTASISDSRKGAGSFKAFKDKNYVCQMFGAQVKRKVEKYKQEQSQTPNSYSPNPKIYGETEFNTDDEYYYDASGYKRRR